MRANRKLIVILLSVSAVIFFSKSSGITDYVTIDQLTLLLQRNLVTSSVIFILIFCLANLLYIPGWIIISAPILVLPPLTAYFLILAGAISACCSSFFLIGLFGKGLLNDLDNKYANKALQKLEENPLLAIFILRVLMQTNPALNYTLSLSKVKFKDYLLGTILGLPIPVAIYCLFYDILTDYLDYP